MRIRRVRLPSWLPNRLFLSGRELHTLMTRAVESGEARVIKYYINWRGWRFGIESVAEYKPESRASPPMRGK